MKPRIAVVQHRLSFNPIELSQVLDGVVDIVWVLDASVSENPRVTRIVGRLGRVVDASNLTVEEVASRLADEGIDGILTFVDAMLPFAAQIAEKLGLPFHTPEAAEALYNKARQRAVLTAAGVPGPKFWSVDPHLDESQVREIANLVSYPAVLKPQSGAGSFNVTRLEGPGDLVAAVQDSPIGWVVEGYLEDLVESAWYASFLSVETVVSRGEISHVALSGRFPLAAPFRETGHFIPAVVPLGLYDSVLDVADQAIAAIGITDAVLHIEIKLTPDGPCIIEVNGRAGGDQPFTLKEVSGINLFQVAAQVAAGIPVRLKPALVDSVGFALFVQPPDTAQRVATFDGIDDIGAIPGVEVVVRKVTVGDAVDWKRGTASHVLIVRGRVADHEALEATIDRIYSTMQISYEGEADAETDCGAPNGRDHEVASSRPEDDVALVRAQPASVRVSPVARRSA